MSTTYHQLSINLSNMLKILDKLVNLPSRQMQKTYIIAEIGNTHEGSLGLAKNFIKSAAECGVDAVKFQHIFLKLRV